MKPARFLLPISVLILGMSQSALAEKDGTAETVEAEKKEAPAPWAGSTVVYSNFARIQTTYDYATSRCGNAGTNAADPVNIDADGCEETELGNNYDPYYAMSLSPGHLGDSTRPSVCRHGSTSMGSLPRQILPTDG